MDSAQASGRYQTVVAKMLSQRVGGRGDDGEDTVVRLVGVVTSADLGGSSN